MRKASGREVMECLNIRVEPELIKRIDALAKKADIDRPRLVRNILEMQVKYLERVDKIGLFTFGVILRDLEETMKAWVEGCIDEPGEVLSS